MTKIEWTEKSWNPIVGCSIVSPGCTNCYAMKQAARLLDKPGSHYEGTTQDSKGGAVWTGKIGLAPELAIEAPLRRKKPTVYFVNSMGDLFHEDAPDEWIDRVFAVMALCYWHTFQVLTKRPERMWDYMARSAGWLPDPVVKLMHQISGDYYDPWKPAWPLPNVWLGTSCEDQRRADERILPLIQAPAAIRFISAEPLLGPIDFTDVRAVMGRGDALAGDGCSFAGLDWVIVGGESGPGARPFDTEWAESIVEQCRAAGVPCFVKQLGSHVIQNGERRIKRDKKGGDMSEWPHAIRVREMPTIAERQAA